VLGWVAERYPQLIRDIAARGHEIACHGFSHRLVYEQSRKSSTRRRFARRTCSRTLPVRSTRISRGELFHRTRVPLALDILAELGFVYDSSIFPVRMIAMAFPTPNGLRTDGHADWKIHRRVAFSDGKDSWISATRGGRRVLQAVAVLVVALGLASITDANCDHSSSICTRGKSIRRNRACLPAGYRGFVIIRTSENVSSGCGACSPSFDSAPRETVLRNSAYFPHKSAIPCSATNFSGRIAVTWTTL